MKLTRIVSGLAVMSGLLRAAAVDQPAALVWDSDLKEIQAAANQETARFFFLVTNVSSASVMIRDVHPSCGCTLVSLPSKPWKLAPGDHGKVEVEVDLVGKSGMLIKTLSIISSVGSKDLVFKVHLPEWAKGSGGLNLLKRVQRAQNRQMAAGDRQAIFRKDCARCHVAPAVGKRGGKLYEKACGICHDAVHRASMVPELTDLPHRNNRDYWMKWITQGKEDSLMPAFAEAAGGPLTSTQIDSLVSYLLSRIADTGARSAPAAITE